MHGTVTIDGTVTIHGTVMIHGAIPSNGAVPFNGARTFNGAVIFNGTVTIITIAVHAVTTTGHGPGATCSLPVHITHARPPCHGPKVMNCYGRTTCRTTSTMATWTRSTLILIPKVTNIVECRDLIPTHTDPTPHQARVRFTPTPDAIPIRTADRRGDLLLAAEEGEPEVTPMQAYFSIVEKMLPNMVHSST